MRFFDKKFRKNAHRYILQCVLATLTILAVLIFVLTETAIIAALGASAFIVFTMPNKYSSDPRRLIGGYIVGIVVGMLCNYISFIEYLSNFFITQKMALIVFGAIFFGKPEWIQKLKEGFDTLNQLPDWYIWALMAAIASSFGLKVTDLAIKKFKK